MASSAPAAVAPDYFTASGTDLEPLNAPTHRAAAAAASAIWTGRQHGQTSWLPAPRIPDEDLPRTYVPVPVACQAAAAVAVPELAEGHVLHYDDQNEQSDEATIAKLHAFSEQLLNTSSPASVDATGGPGPGLVPL